jgi:hypothetical protein
MAMCTAQTKCGASEGVFEGGVIEVVNLAEEVFSTGQIQEDAGGRGCQSPESGMRAVGPGAHAGPDTKHALPHSARRQSVACPM